MNDDCDVYDDCGADDDDNYDDLLLVFNMMATHQVMIVLMMVYDCDGVDDDFGVDGDGVDDNYIC